MKPDALPRGLRVLGALEVPGDAQRVTCPACLRETPLTEHQRHERADRWRDDVPVEVWYTCIWCRARLPTTTTTETA